LKDDPKENYTPQQREGKKAQTCKQVSPRDRRMACQPDGQMSLPNEVDTQEPQVQE
jgi:hypothetical protein